MYQKKLMRDLKPLLGVIHRKCHDWSFSTPIIWIRLIYKMSQFFFRRLIRRFEPGSIHVLLYAHFESMKFTQNLHGANMLRTFMEKIIGREFSEKGPGHNYIKDTGNVTEQDLKLLKEAGIVLKKPRFVNGQLIEKGVLLIAFTERFRTFHFCVDVASVLGHYVLVLEPSWSGRTDPDIMYFTRYSDHSVIVMSAETRDFQFLENLGTNLIPVHFDFGDWVNPLLFRPIMGQEKFYDVIMVARYAVYKRHHALFRVLSKFNDPSIRVALAGINTPNEMKEIRTLIKYYQVGNNLTLFENLSPQDLNLLLNRSKVNLLLSLQEGGNRSLFEGFFAGVPGVALKNNIGIPKNYFNSQTGMLIDEKDLGDTILYFRNHWSKFDPHTWAMKNISPDKSIQKLNRMLKNLAHQRGEEWTRDAVTICNEYKGPVYYPDDTVGRDLPTMPIILEEFKRNRS
jgi:glycosyltransferase involved in cell wall biosynthesis